MAWTVPTYLRMKRAAVDIGDNLILYDWSFVEKSGPVKYMQAHTGERSVHIVFLLYIVF